MIFNTIFPQISIKSLFQLTNFFIFAFEFHHIEILAFKISLIINTARFKQLTELIMCFNIFFNNI